MDSSHTSDTHARAGRSVVASAIFWIFISQYFYKNSEKSFCKNVARSAGRVCVIVTELAEANNLF
jgi:hypothetical protein